jgi:hypothetical protein
MGCASFMGADNAGRPKVRPANPSPEATNIARRLTDGVVRQVEWSILVDSCAALIRVPWEVLLGALTIVVRPWEQN